VTSQAPATAQPVMVAAFPGPGRLVTHAYRELQIAATGTKEQLKALGDINTLPRPWEPGTCTNSDLRLELWQWLEAVVTWLNSQYVWDVATMIPSCWPQHPHLVHEIAVLADQRRRAGTALSSDALEEWHRYALPAFTERMRQRVKAHCEEGHQPWPAKGRYTRHTAEAAVENRHQVYRDDTAVPLTAPSPSAGPRLHIVDGQRVDTRTGEIID